MSWKSFVTDYLSFSKKDRIALGFVVAAILFVYLVPDLYYTHKTGHALAEDTLLSLYRDSLVQRPASPAASLEYPDEDLPPLSHPPAYTKGHLFPFDPNTLDAAGWKKLGLPEKTATTILRYRNKGGRFYKKEDLKKIWGLPPQFYEDVADYIRIESAAVASFPSSGHSKKPREIQVIDLNTADTAELIALPGIGSRLAQRIIAFRDKLGGFYTTGQVAETYGLPDSTFQKIRKYLSIQSEGVRKININTAIMEELQAHPYIRWKLANAITAYREQHGPYKAVTELKNIVLIDDATFEKIRPYLSVE